jgi:DNA recombination protein RmuC
MVVVYVILGFALGAAAVALLARERIRALRGEIERERTDGQERAALLLDAKTQFETTLKAVAGEALSQNSRSFLDLAKSELGRKEQAVEHLVKPLNDSLARVEKEVQKLERDRLQTATALTSSLKHVAETNERVRLETASLATALRAPEVRGAWGQMALRNAVEAAGMLSHCDFDEEVSVNVQDGRLRPDMVVRLPGGRRVVVDAKTPLKALLDAANSPDEATREALMHDFGRHVREHVTKLSAKAYWQQFDQTPDFVIMFLPGESFYRTAVEREPALLELSAGQRVILASPMLLITVLKTISVCWREEKVAESARAVSELGRELYERLAVLSEHFATVGKRLDSTVQAYNQSVGSFERRVLVQARRFTEHGIGSSRELVSPTAIERSAQIPQTAELPPARGEHVQPELPAADAA